MPIEFLKSCEKLNNREKIEGYRNVTSSSYRDNRESQINEHAIHGIVDFFIEHILR